MKSLLSIIAGTALGVAFALPSVSAQPQTLPDDSPGSGAIIQPHEGVGQPDPLRNDPADGSVGSEPIDPGAGDDELLGRSQRGFSDDRLEDDFDDRTDEEGVAGDAPLREDDPDVLDDDLDGLDDEPGLDEPGTMPGADDGIDGAMGPDDGLQ